jgi:hypothetical protein
MRQVNFNPDELSGEQLEWWNNWISRAEKARNEVLENWESWQQDGSNRNIKFSCNFKEEIWKDLKNWLLENFFCGKCAYCEAKEVRSPYDAEHFRPKAKVSICHSINISTKKRNLSVIKILDEANGMEGEFSSHPGYFWLAYHWKNILPSCKSCNSARGKNSQFPVAKTHVFDLLEPEELDRKEVPLLLNPYIDNPQEHIIFGEFGVVAAVEESIKGHISIEVYDLDDERLRIARQEAQHEVRDNYHEAIYRGILNNPEIDIDYAINVIGLNWIREVILDRNRAFSAAIVDYLRAETIRVYKRNVSW